LGAIGGSSSTIGAGSEVTTVRPSCHVPEEAEAEKEEEEEEEEEEKEEVVVVVVPHYFLQAAVVPRSCSLSLCLKRNIHVQDSGLQVGDSVMTRTACGNTAPPPPPLSSS